MTMTPEQRLGSVENVLSAVAVTLQTVATLTERNSTAIDQLGVQIAQTNTAIDRLEVQIDRLEVQVAKVTKNLDDNVIELVSMIGHVVEEGERERHLLTERMDAAQAAADADRAEIRRILDYLFSQQSNGNGKNTSEDV